MGDAQAGLASAYDAIARLYDPWSRSVVEDLVVLRRGGIARGARACRRARRRYGPHRRSRRRGRHRRHRCRLLGGHARHLPRRCGAGGRPRSSSSCGSATTRGRPSPSASPSCSARSARISTCTREEERLEALRAARDLLVPGGRLVFDVFTPSAEDIEETHGRWLEREPGIFERADWDTHAPCADAVAARPGRRDDDGARLGLPGRMARGSCTRPGSRSTPATAGSTGGRGRARRTRFGSRPVLL